jgi:hypothetical protein
LLAPALETELDGLIRYTTRVVRNKLPW